ncbi:MAG: aminodeoxychorismate synthase component I [bacterium]|nr:aminodeoxychorismate synthase component I [bacterium]
MLPSVLLFDAANRVWLAFENPVEIITATNIEDVAASMLLVQNRVETEQLWAAGFLSYEASPAFDRSLIVHSESEFPKLWFGLYREPRRFALPDDADEAADNSLKWTSSIGREEYDANICRIKNLIARGDTYQVNFTTRLRADISSDFNSASYFQSLIQDQQASYAAYLDIGDHVICSASPELFFRLDGNFITTRPMKGTVHRGRTTLEDAKLSEWLAQSEKNRAENVMIVDMMRNDLGKIAKVGSVQVPQLFALERYPTVWQMISEVTASTDASFSQIISALFPAASVTGAPKPKTMAIIADLEPEARKIYTGTIGFLSPNRRAQFSVPIRTVLIDRTLRTAEYGVGGGIVWDSNSAEEYDECQTKAKVLARRPRDFSLLETLLWTPNGGYFLLEEHLSRLNDSADYFGFEFDLAKARKSLATLYNQLDGRQKIRLLLDRRGTITLQNDAIADVVSEVPLRLRFAKDPIDSSDVFLYHKTTNRGCYESARQSVEDCDDVVLFNREGFITETTIDNIIVKRSDGAHVTPPVSCGLLAGTYRASLLSEGKIIEDEITIEQLKRATSITVINSVRGWRNAVLVVD